DPLAGVVHWERALRAAHQRQGDEAVALTKLLVSARADRGGVPVSKERLDAVVKEFDFAGYFATSAKEGWRVGELRAAIESAIPWDELPTVTSSALFATIKSLSDRGQGNRTTVSPGGPAVRGLRSAKSGGDRG